MSPSLVLLLALAPETCAPSDLACTAREKAREAREATDPEERAHARLTAARAHLALYRKTGARADLCAARRLVHGVPRRTKDLGELPQKTRTEVEAELAKLKHDCSVRHPPGSPAAPTATTPSPLESSAAALPAAALPTTPEVGSPIPVETVSPSDGEALLEVKPPPVDAVRSRGREGPKGSTASPDPEAPTVSLDGRQPSLTRPGRGLLIAGGISLGAASVLGGVAAYAALRVDTAMTRHDGLAAEANGQGYTSPDVGVMRRDLEADAPYWRRVMIGTAITSGVLTGAAVALLTVGAVKRRQTPARLALHPILPGLLLIARF